jgi:hypothetical protein
LRIGQNRSRKSDAHGDSPDASSRYFAVRVDSIERHVIDVRRFRSNGGHGIDRIEILSVG